ncbi:MAG TPA: hypothetical protein VFB02_13960 [Bradyrhizobium sp.]|nr:hypothetical protein [Bradyrhizobium sp.]
MLDGWGGATADVPGEWETKEAVSYPVLDRWGRHFLVWHFPNVGSRIQRHAHEPKKCHDTILIKGTLKVTGEAERGDCTVTAPDYLRFEAGVEHSFTAVTAGALAIHVFDPEVDPNGVT